MKEFINIALKIENKTKTGDRSPHKSHQFVWVLNRFFIISFQTGQNRRAVSHGWPPACRA
jgi:hypothetical protein